MAGAVKAFNLPIDYVLYEMSYANVILYSAVLPSYSAKKKGDRGHGQERAIDADDPKNREKVNAILFG